MDKQLKKRDSFTSSFGVLVATLGSAVGLGNIWKFPALTGGNGGASFLFIYLIATLLVGLPIMMCELSLGRATKTNMVTTMVNLAPKGKPWWLVSIVGLAAATFILAFYTEVAGWVFAYLLKAVSGDTISTDVNAADLAFTTLISSPGQALIWQWVVLIFIGTIITFGVSRGIEAVAKKLMPILFLLLIGLCIRSLTLPGASEGLRFLFYPDFSKINSAVILAALGLAFFKLSIGMGCMMTYGSYFTDDQNIPLTATRVMFADLFVSLLAGIAIFPAVFAFGFAPEAGPSLVFMTIPAVFASLPFGHLFMALFFILTAIAATGAMLSILEVPVSVLSERWNIPRRRATFLVLLLIALLGAPAALSKSLMADQTLFGMNFFDFYDFLSSNLLLPLCGLGIAVFVGWVWGYQKWHMAISNQGTLNNQRTSRIFFFLAKYTAPLAVIIILLHGLGVF
jgi:NSS family neurotransmitter:Na+ symporter